MVLKVFVGVFEDLSNFLISCFFKVKIEHFLMIKARFLLKIKIKLTFRYRRCFLTGPNFL